MKRQLTATGVVGLVWAFIVTVISWPEVGISTFVGFVAIVLTTLLYMAVID